MKYTYRGPAKPIPTTTQTYGYFKPSELAWRVLLLAFLIGTLLMDLLVWRPN
jgi:hypothetical protein